MKPITKTGFAALVLLLAMSCKKESSAIRSSNISNESSMQAAMTDVNAPAKIASVTIGTQVWMKRDLTVSHYRNGDTIPEVKDRKTWSALTTGAWCWYGNNPAAGKLYNWYAVNDPRGLAPTGWHIPNNAEWDTLTKFLGGVEVAGGKMKEAGTTHWLLPNTDATNSSDFTGLPGGYRVLLGTFADLGRTGNWWSSTEYDVGHASYYYLYLGNGAFAPYNFTKRHGFSVRCIKD